MELGSILLLAGAVFGKCVFLLGLLSTLPYSRMRSIARAHFALWTRSVLLLLFALFFALLNVVLDCLFIVRS